MRILNPIFKPSGRHYRNKEINEGKRIVEALDSVDLSVSLPRAIEIWRKYSKDQGQRWVSVPDEQEIIDILTIEEES